MSSLMTHHGRNKSGFTVLVQEEWEEFKSGRNWKTGEVALEQTGMRLVKIIMGEKQHWETREEITDQKWWERQRGGKSLYHGMGQSWNWGGPLGFNAHG